MRKVTSFVVVTLSEYSVRAVEILELGGVRACWVQT